MLILWALPTGVAGVRAAALDVRGSGGFYGREIAGADEAQENYPWPRMAVTSESAAQYGEFAAALSTSYLASQDTRN